MNIKGVNFDNCFLSSGALNFFGDGYFYDYWFRLLVPGYKIIDQTTFVAKTATLNYRAGNMSLNKNFRPKSLKPGCIKIYPFRGLILNAVGLSNPGIRTLLDAEKWQNNFFPFFISIMAVGESREERIKEIESIIDILKVSLPDFATTVGIQVNISCPNTKHQTKDLTYEALSMLGMAAKLDCPLDLKVNTLISLETVREIEQSGLCDVLTMSNTIPYGTDGINWKKTLGKQSPLKKFGGGGLSGKDILPLVLDKISFLRGNGIIMPIKGSGGILSAADVDRMKLAGANAIEIGSVLILRPWRARSIVNRANEIF